MEAVEIVFCDLVQRFRLWLPRRVETQVMSRDFWMPDQSCRVCYECDTPFSLFKRRHHCRICGRIFCGRCTQNTVPIIDVQSGICNERERVRACTFCFKLRQEECKQDIVQKVVVKPLTPSLTPSSSNFSLSSSGSSSSGMSTSTASTAGNPSQVVVSFGYKASAIERMDPNAEKKQRRPMRTSRKNGRSKSPKGRDLSPNPYDFCSNRSDDDETDDAKDVKYQATMIYDVESQEEEEGDNNVEEKNAVAAPKLSLFDFPENFSTYINDVTGKDEEMRHEEVRSEMDSIPHVDRSFSRRSMMSSDEYEGPEESVDESNFYVPSLVHESAPAGEEPVDLENNELIWVPPPPEDEDQEIATSIVGYDDDDEEEESGWGSFSSSEQRIREKATASQEQRKAMRAVVDGHFRALVGQLLDGEGLGADDCERESWLEIVISLASEAASLLKPNTSKEGGMDPGGYVKVKCIASGQRGDSCVVKGVVCKKNVAHRRMTLLCKNPQLLLLGGALEYQRVPNQLSSLDTLLQQEKEYLSMTAARIEAHHPNVVLVEKTVSRQAQERLLSNGIALVLNVKMPLLERIARCTGAEIVPAPDQIIKAKLGRCDLFHVEKFNENLGSAGQGGKTSTKTLMFFEGCPRPLACTVLLRGAIVEELKKVKRVAQFAIFAAYQLALETSFLVDERATLPVLSSKSPISVALPDKPSKLDRSISTVPDFLLPAPGSSFCHPEGQSAPFSVPSSCFSSRNNSPSVSPRATDTHVFTVRTVQPQKSYQGPVISTGRRPASSGDQTSSTSLHRTLRTTSIGVQCVASMYGTNRKLPSASLNNLNLENAEECSRRVIGLRTAASESDVTHFSDLTSDSLWEEQEANHEEFPSSSLDHHGILVSFSSRCLRKRIVCERGRVFRIKYYGSFDKPLGKFLKDDVFDLNNVCGVCEEPRDAHIHCYMHRQDSLTISVHQQKDALLGEREGKIWMWHRCLKCARVKNVPPATHRVLMSDAAWGLSFGKFLDLSFSNHTAASRIAACGHSLHKDCLRFYGFGRMVACFRYVPIDVYSVYLPPSKLEFNHPELTKWLDTEIAEVREKVKLVFEKAMYTLREIEKEVASSGISKTAEAVRPIAKYEASLSKSENAFLAKLPKAPFIRKEGGDSFADILELNSARRELAASYLVWSQRFQGLRESLGLNKTVRTFRSVNLDDRSLLPEIKEKKLIDSHESCNTFVSDVIEGTKSSLHHANTVMDETVIEGQHSCSSHSSYVAEPKNSEIGNKLAGNAKETDCTGQSSGGEDFNHCSELKFGKIFSPNSVPHSQNNYKTNVQETATSFGDKDKQDDITLSKTENLASIVEAEPKLRGENSRYYTNMLEEDDLLVRRTLSEGQFPLPPDLSDTFEAAWTGKEHTVEAHKVSISSTGQEIISQGSGTYLPVAVDEAAPVAATEDVLSTVASSSSEDNCSGSEGLVPGAPSSPPKSEILEDWSLAKSPFSSFWMPYSKSSQFLSSGSPAIDPHWLYNSYSMMLPAGEGRIFLPLGISDTVIPVYDDEPTSVIAYAITSQQYQAHLSDGPSRREKIWERERERGDKQDFKDRVLDSLTTESAVFHPLQGMEGISEHIESTPKDRAVHTDDTPNVSLRESSNLQYSKATHLKVSFTDAEPQGKVKFMVTCYYAKQFDALRRTCCSDPMDFIRSLCRCKKWGAQGGKSNVFFAKTRDDRFVIKQVTKTELESFIKFAPAYFDYISQSLKTGSPTCLAKILGIFQVTVKHAKHGREIRMDLMAMENLLSGRLVTRLYDLKGSLRSRYNNDTTGVLLDQNLLESNPIFIGKKAKRILERAVWNDTSFLTSIDVMDYSLLVGVDEERHELVVGIIDFMRQYTWDKHLETWVKASGILGGPKNATPTVISPKHYKKRFRKAMRNYILVVPDQWSDAAEMFGPPHVDSVESFQSS